MEYLEESNSAKSCKIYRNVYQGYQFLCTMNGFRKKDVIVVNNMLSRLRNNSVMLGGNETLT